MAHEANQFGEWRSWHPQEVAQFFRGLTVPWWISGGWALDLFLGRTTRMHQDIDVQFLRRDSQVIRELFQGWDILEADHLTIRPAEWPFREWQQGTSLSPGIHDIWCRPAPTSAWALQLMVADTVADQADQADQPDQWVFRRDTRIRRPLAEIGDKTADGIPYLAPEIQLLYKANGQRPKDEADFVQVLPYLDRTRSQWLAQALALVHPGHPWLAQLSD